MTALLSIAPTPVDLGLPPRFAKWRPIQSQAVSDGIEAQTRFVVQALPTGTGKSCSNMAQGVVAGRFVYLTATRALQSQITEEFGEMGVVDIRGRSNYPCTFGQSRQVTCEDGAILGCRAHRDGTCPYVNALNEAKRRNPVTNYAYWIAVNRYGEGLGDVDLLIADEASACVDEICKAMTIELTNRELHALRALPTSPDLITFRPTLDSPIDEWRTWARVALGVAQTLTKALEDRIRGETTPRNGNASGSVPEALARELKQTKGLESKLTRLAKSEGNWVPDQLKGDGGGSNGYRFDPVWPADYAEDVLWCGVPRVLATSATINRKTCHLLGMPADDLTYCAYPAVFNPRKSPIEWVRCDARVDSRMTEDMVRAWMWRIDHILRRPENQNVKGIIHCTSYQRQKDIYRMTSERRRMMWHSSYNAEAKIEEFKQMPEESGAVLISPAVTTGYDFKDSQCRFIIVAKVPLIDRRGRITKARLKEDADWGDYLEGQVFEQECGRATRSEKDYSRVYICDDHFEWFYPKMRRKGFVSKALQQRVAGWR